MIKILYDFLTLHLQNGATQYNRRVFHELQKEVERREGIHLYCLYDSKALPTYSELLIDNIIKENIDVIDIQEGVQKVNNIGCDVFFLACAQKAASYPELANISCRSIIVFHDCVWEELYRNDIFLYMMLNNEDVFRYRGTKPLGWKVYWSLRSPTVRFCRWLLHARQRGLMEKDSGSLEIALKLFDKRPDNEIITVSNYSKYSISYNFDCPEDKIHVLYSPERIYNTGVSGRTSICNSKLRDIIKVGKPYYLMVNAERDTKNIKKVLRVFEYFSKVHTNALIVTVGYKRETLPNHVDLCFLDDYDLEMAYKNCYALVYPSYFEGFGYPPVEAMKYGKPVLSSNVCSMPEILGDAPIYFSPFYESAIFAAFCKLDDDYHLFAEKSLDRFRIIAERQNADMKELLDLLLCV